MQSFQLSRLFPFTIIMMCIVMSPMMLTAAPVNQENVTIQELVIGNTEFAVDFFMELAFTQESNFVFSPYSLSNAFAMTYAGARDITAEQMREVFYFLPSPEELHPAFSALNILLNSEDRTSRVVVANAIWGDQNFQFNPVFQQIIINNYANGFRLVDFQNSSETARQEINQWAVQQTDGKINNLIPAGAIDALTRLVLTNAILFKADWLFPFDSNETKPRAFYTPDGAVDVPMMTVNEIGFQCIGKEEDYDFEFTAIRLRYADELASFVIIMPNEKAYERFFEEFDGAVFTEILYTMSGCFGRVSMPRFSVSTNVSVKPLLIEMGLTDAFGALADFSGMSAAPELYISEAFHQATIDVTEKGTEATAASAVVMGVRSGGAVDLVIDSPFIFAILDNMTDTVLFMGLVVNPLEN